MFRRKKEAVPQHADFIVVGLGNPGQKYDMTRHNAGFLAVDALAKALDCGMINHVKCRALYTCATVDGKSVILMKPQTFMNLSGEAVRDMAESFSVPVQNIIVLSDDISLPCGKIRVRRSGSAGGHNGLKNIIYQMNSDAFPRIKIGVGAPQGDLVDYVLDVMDTDTLEAIKRVPDAVITIMRDGVSDAMQKSNGVKE